MQLILKSEQKNAVTLPPIPDLLNPPNSTNDLEHNRTIFQEYINKLEEYKNTLNLMRNKSK